MQGKVVLVTGANGGLGRYVTQSFLDAGATVVGNSRKIQQSDFSGANFVALSAGISTREGAALLVDQAVARCGRLDVLVHTVGAFAGGQSVVDIDDVTFQRMLEDLYSAFHILRAAIPALQKTGDGRIIAIGSKAAVDPGARTSVLTVPPKRPWFLSEPSQPKIKPAGVTANVILPGTMDTPANRKAMPGSDFSKWVKPERVASLITWLAGDAAKDVNGAVIPVYGSDV